jgi:DNA replicative helicase MCM subunit Mcm2 (Cdc46/Mcm family)
MNNEIDKNSQNINQINIIEKNEKSLEKIITTEDIINYISSYLLQIIQKNKQMKKSHQKALMSLYIVNSFLYYQLKNFY